MPVLHSRLSSASESYATNFAHMEAQVSDLRDKISHAQQGGGERYQQRHLARGKHLPRQRINALLDPGSTFLER